MNNIKEAIEYGNDCLQAWENWARPDCYQVKFYELAVEALKKQMPKKPIDDSYPWVICPTCGGSVFMKHITEYIQNNETTYCEHCGQAIDWNEEKSNS